MKATAIVLLFVLLSASVSLAATVQGTIIDSRTDTPIKNATVITLPPTRQVCTDSEGRYLIYGLQKNKSYSVVAGKKGYRVNHADILIRVDSVRCDFALRTDEGNQRPRRCIPIFRSQFKSPNSICGLVVNWTTDRQVTGAEVYTIPPTERVRTDELGAFCIQNNIKPGEYTLFAEAKEDVLYEPDGYAVLVRPEAVTRCDMAMISRPVEKQPPGQLARLSKRLDLAARQREVIEIDVEAPFTVEAEAKWSGSAENLSLILNGPGKRGYYARVNGESPLRMVYRVSDKVNTREIKWTLTVANFYPRQKAQGEVFIRVTR